MSIDTIKLNFGDDVYIPQAYTSDLFGGYNFIIDKNGFTIVSGGFEGMREKLDKYNGEIKITWGDYKPHFAKINFSHGKPVSFRVAKGEHAFPFSLDNFTKDNGWGVYRYIYTGEFYDDRPKYAYFETVPLNPSANGHYYDHDQMIRAWKSSNKKVPINNGNTIGFVDDITVEGDRLLVKVKLLEPIKDIPNEDSPLITMVKGELDSDDKVHVKEIVSARVKGLNK